MESMKQRDMRETDLEAVGALAEAAGLFPAAELPEMASEGLGGDAPDIWRVAETPDAQLAGFSFTRAETFADGTWNMLALAVGDAFRRKGVAADLVADLKAVLALRKGRILIVDTSSSGDFDAARAFYTAQGFVTEARIRDYWGPGDDKITFWSAL